MKKTLIQWLCLPVAAAVLAACGGGGGSLGASSPITISGTAAVGAPLAGAKVKVYDATGTLVADNGTVQSNGSYAITIPAGKSAPFVFVVDDSDQQYVSILNDISQTSLDKALATIGKNLDRQVSRGKISEADKAAALGRIRTTLKLSDLGPTDLIIEAATERETVKQAIFEDLLPHLKPSTILTSNTSSISITRLKAQLFTMLPTPCGTMIGCPAAMARRLGMWRWSKCACVISTRSMYFSTNSGTPGMCPIR